MIMSAIFTLVLGVLIFLILPRGGWIAVSLFIALTIGSYAGTLSMMSFPKPLWLEWRDITQANVISAVPVENVAIYIWLDINRLPRAYVLPWSQKMAQQLQDAMNKAESDGTSVEMAMTSESGNGGEPQFYAKPQPPLPPKM